MGGVFYMTGSSGGKAKITAQNNIFIQNLAYLGGVFGLSSQLVLMDALIVNNSFYNNFGSSDIPL